MLSRPLLPTSLLLTYQYPLERPPLPHIPLVSLRLQPQPALFYQGLTSSTLLPSDSGIYGVASVWENDLADHRLRQQRIRTGVEKIRSGGAPVFTIWARRSL